ncbi:MAG TPA: alpha/beta fold hydrolase [Candidatus Saccharimonadales bacterium]
MKTIYLHGFTGDKHGLEPLAAELKFSDKVLIDLPAFGFNKQTYSLDWASYLKAVKKTIDPHLGKGGIRLIGHSYGCMVAYGLAVRYPELVRELILICPVARGSMVQRLFLGLNTVLLSAVNGDVVTRLYSLPVMVNLASVVSWRPSWPRGALSRIMKMRKAESKQYSPKQLELLGLVKEFRKTFQTAHAEIPAVIVHASADALVAKSDPGWYQKRLRGEILQVKGGHLAPIARVSETAKEITKRYTAIMSQAASKPKIGLKIIIMTAAFGAGHKSVARHLAELLKNLDKDADIKTVDVIADAWPWFGKASSDTYASSTANSSFLFKVYYHLTDRFPAPLRWFAGAAFHRYAKEKYAKEQPDLIVSTFPFLADVAVAGRNANQGHAPVVVVVTDAGNVQGIWISKHADMTFTATPDTVDYLKKRGMKSGKVMYAGFPQPPEKPKLDKQSLREELGLEKDCFTVLLTAGGQGLSPTRALNMAKALADIKDPFQVVLNAGTNDELKREFEKLSFDQAKKVIVTGFTDKLHDYMRASDVACTKAGWLTIQEAITLGTPLVIYNAIPGHEEQNVHFAVSREFGFFSDDPRQCVEFIERAMKQPKLLAAYHKNMQAFMAESDPNVFTAAIKELLNDT